jgi:hypothetical protein
MTTTKTIIHVYIPRTKKKKKAGLAQSYIKHHIEP